MGREGAGDWTATKIESLTTPVIETNQFIYNGPESKRQGSTSLAGHSVSTGSHTV